MPEPLAEPFAWLATSIGLYLGWAVLVRHLGPVVSGSERARLPAPAMALARSAAAAAYFVGIPYVALIWGVLDLRSLGLSIGDPTLWLPVAAMVTLATWTVLALAWRRWQREDSGIALHRAADGGGEAAAWSLADAVTQQSHVAFYRSVIALTGGAYAGVFAGLGLVLAERVAGAAIRRRWPGRGTAEGEIVLGATLTASSLIFLATQSLPACMAAHFVIQYGTAAVASRRQGEAQPKRPA